MSIELTELQQQALDAERGVPRVIDPRTNTQYLLIPAEGFEAIRETREDDDRQRAIRRVGLRNAIGRMEEL